MICPIDSCPFTQEQAEAAYREWGCNCGPAALAFACQLHLDAVRHAIPGFAEKRYTSPTMMKGGLRTLGRTWSESHVSEREMFWPDCVCLVRVQWSGPWTQPGANPKWAYRQTHWIATYMVERQAALVFDMNGGVRGFQSWVQEIVPLLTGSTPRADGGFFPTHIWRVHR